MNEKKEKELLYLAETVSKLGTWELELKTNHLIWSDGVFRICGYQPGEFEVNFETALAVIHPDDQPLALAKMTEAIEKGTPYEIRKRFITKNKDIVHILSRGKVINDEAGNPVKLFGVFQDITSTVLLEESYKKAIHDLKSRNHFIETIVENLPIGIAVNKISSGEATMVNKSFASTYGWGNQDLTDIPSFFEKVYPEEAYRKEIVERVMSDIESGDPERMAWKNIVVTTSKNEKRIINAKNIPVFEQDLMISTVIDVTEKTKLTEKQKTQEANLTALIENTPDIIYSIDLDFKLITFNSVFSRLVKEIRNVDIEVGMNVFDLYSESKKESYLAIFNTVKKGSRYIFQDIVTPSNRTTYYLEVSVNPILSSKNTIIGFSVFSKDITENKMLEQKREKALKELNKIMDFSSDIICTFDENERFVKVNAASERIWGYLPQELEGKHYKILVHPEDYDLTYHTTQDIKSGRNVSHFENRNVRKDGTIVYMLWSAVFDEEEKLTYCTAKEISELKAAERKIQQSEQYFKNLIQDGSDLIGILDAEGNYQYVSPTSSAILGIPPEEFVGKNAFDFIHPEDVELVIADFERSATEKRVKINPFRFKNADGSWRWIETIVTNLLDDPTVKGIVSNSRDVTEQKQNEKALKQSNQLLKNAQRITQMGNWEYHSPTDEMYWAEEIYHLFEIDAEPNKKHKFQDFTRFIHPDDLDEFLVAKNKLEKDGIPLSIQHRIITANQNIKHVKELGERVFNEETNSYWLWVTIRDNTNAILDTESLKKSEEKYKFLFDNNPACMMIFDWETLEIIDCNEEALLLYGYSREEILKLTIRDIRLPEDIELINNATKDEETYRNLQKRVWRHQKKNGEIFHVNINRHLIEYEGRKSSLVQITDITDQLKAQEELKRSEEQHKILYQQSPLPKVIYDIHTFTVLDINEMAIKLYGYSREEFIGKTLYDLRIPEEHHSIKNLLKRLKTLQGSENFGIFKHRRKNGTVLDIEFFAHKFNYNDKEALVAVYTDVTEKQQALKQLQDREEKLLLAQSLAKIGSWDYDLRSKSFSWSAEMYKIFDINEETFQHYNANSLIHLLDPEDQPKAFEVRKKVLATGESFKLEYRITPKNGVRKVIEEVGYGERDNKNELIRFFGTSQDITERKQAEIQVKESELKYRSFFENSMDGILLTVTDGDILAANPAACEIFRMTEEEIKQSGRMGLVDHADPRLHELLKTRQTKGKARGELTLQRKGGSKFIGELASVMFVDSQGRERTSMIIRDLTKQKENEAALLESNKRFEYVTMATSDAVWDWDLKTDHINWGKGLQQIFGYSNDATGANFRSNNIHPADREKVLDSIYQIIQGSDQKWNAEYRFKKADGTYAFVSDHGFIIRDEQQNALRMVGAMNDITQRKQEEERLKLLESVVTNTNDAVVITEAEPFDEPGPKIIYVNDAFSRMTGYSAEEVIGKTPRFLQGPESDRAILNGLSQAIKKWEPHEVTLINYRKNGEPFWINFSTSPVSNSKGWFTHWVAIERDVTETKKNEEQLIQAFSEKATILESIGDAFFTVDENWTVTYWNYQAEHWLKTPKEKILGHNLWEIFSSSINSLSFQKYHEALKNSRVERFEDYYDELECWFEISAYPAATGLSVFFKDITERRRIQQQFEAVIQNLPGITYRSKIDEYWTMLFISDGLFDITGYTPSQVINNAERTFADIIHPEDLVHTYAVVQQLRDHDIFNIEYRIICADGSIKWVEDKGRGVYGPQNEILFIDGVIMDVTQRKEYEKQLNELNDDLIAQAKSLKSINAELEQFAYVASHDLQEPLRMVTSFVTQIEKKYGDLFDEKGKEYIYFAVDGAKRMRQIILDLLEFSRVGRNLEQLEVVDINILIQEILDLFKQRIEELGAQVTIMKLPSIQTYKTPLRQVFQNLISNSLKYHQPNQAPKIDIQFKETKTHWQFAVADNGIGIDPVYFEKIFIIFQRLHNKQEYAGTGIGLSITKKIIENFGGQIWITSQKDKGSTFYFTISKTLN